MFQVLCSSKKIMNWWNTSKTLNVAQYPGHNLPEPASRALSTQRPIIIQPGLMNCVPNHLSVYRRDFPTPSVQLETHNELIKYIVFAQGQCHNRTYLAGKPRVASVNGAEGCASDSRNYSTTNLNKIHYHKSQYCTTCHLLTITQYCKVIVQRILLRIQYNSITLSW